MKELEYIINKEKRTVWLRAFHIWQHRPHQVAPLSEEMRECSSCKTTYQGNYCPRCGQSASIGRFSFKKALLLFLDVWGVGNRGMFRTIRDLMLRPGFMIRDYISGMQSAYFPPFKMFFLITAFSLLVQHGFDFGTNETARDIETRMKDNVETQLSASEDEIESRIFYAGMKFGSIMDILREKNPAIFSLLSLVMFTIPLYFFLRSSPTIPDMRYSEFLVALVYTSNAYSIYSIAGNLFNSGILKLIAVIIVFVAMKQFSGYSKWRLLKYIILTILISSVGIMAIVGTGIYVTSLTLN